MREVTDEIKQAFRRADWNNPDEEEREEAESFLREENIVDEEGQLIDIPENKKINEWVEGNLL